MKKLNWKGIVGAVAGAGLLGLGITSLVKKKGNSGVAEVESVFDDDDSEVDDEYESEEE